LQAQFITPHSGLHLLLAELLILHGYLVILKLLQLVGSHGKSSELRHLYISSRNEARIEN